MRNGEPRRRCGTASIGLLAFSLMVTAVAFPAEPVAGAQFSPPWAHLHHTGTAGDDPGSGTGKLAWAEGWMDSVGYDCFAPWQLSAYSTYSYWKHDAVFILAGHGVGDYSTGSERLGGGLVVKDSSGTNAYVLAEDTWYPSRPNGTYNYYTPSGGLMARETYFIKNYGATDIDDCLVALFIGCGTSVSGPRFGNLLDYARAKGVDCTIGFASYNYLEAEGVFGMGFVRGVWDKNYKIDEPVGFGIDHADLLQYAWDYTLKNSKCPTDSNGVQNLRLFQAKGQTGQRLSPARYGMP